MDLAERMAKNVELVAALAESASTVGSIIESTLEHPGKKLAASYGSLLSQISRQMATTVVRVQEMKAITDDLKQLVVVVNIAGRQRMLSQRSMRCFMLSQLLPEKKQQWNNEFSQCEKDFVAALALLEKCPFNSVGIQNNLAMVKNTWLQFVSACQCGELENSLAWNNTLLAELELLVVSYLGLISAG